MTAGNLQGILFDFSGTLFHDEDAADSLHAIGVPAEEHESFMALSERGFANIDRILAADSAFSELWARRDLDSESHREAFIGLDIRAGIPADVAVRWYDRCISAVAWQPYPDTVAVLLRLRAARIAVAVVSNIGWDPRPVFERAGIDTLVDFYALSYEMGMVKPDGRLFEIACAGLGVAPEHTIMVGDDLPSDSGAIAIGCRFVHVDPDRRDRSLTMALGLTRLADDPEENH